MVGRERYTITKKKNKRLGLGCISFEAFDEIVRNKQNVVSSKRDRNLLDNDREKEWDRSFCAVLSVAYQSRVLCTWVGFVEEDSLLRTPWTVSCPNLSHESPPCQATNLTARIDALNIRTHVRNLLLITRCNFPP